LARRSTNFRLECFYEEGKSEWYVGYIKMLGDAGISLHFTDYAYPIPRGFNRAKLRRVDYEEEEEEEEDSVKMLPKMLPKKRTKFENWTEPVFE
jgi:hypothetical protein